MQVKGRLTIKSVFGCHKKGKVNSMAKLKDVLQYVAYGTSLDVIEQNRNQWKHLFPECDLITREVVEEHYPDLLERELANGIHAEGIRKDRLVIPIKKEI